MTSVLVRLAIAGSVAVTAGVFGQTLLKGSEPAVAAPPAALNFVRVAAHTFQVGTLLDGTNAPFHEWDGRITEDMIPKDVAAEQDISGAVIIAPIAKGQAILRSQLLLPGQEGFLAAVLHPGMRAISIAVDAVSGNAGHIFPGDHVDVILTQDLARLTEGMSNQRLASETILQDVRVIAVDQNLNENLKQRDAEKVARTITLEVDQADAQRVTLASGLGKLSLSLRGLLKADLPEVDRLAQPDGVDKEPAAPRPVWANDVSSVLRDYRSPAPGPEPAEATARPVRILRGAAAALSND